jgi:hypothetical protein
MALPVPAWKEKSKTNMHLQAITQLITIPWLCRNSNLYDSPLSIRVAQILSSTRTAQTPS